MAAVELIRLTKLYKKVVAVDQVSLEIGQGEFLFLLGPSGCGKTTTLRMVGGLEEPSSGEIRIQGKNVRGVPPEKRDTSTVFQRWALFPHKTVFENVAFGLKMRKKPASQIKKSVGRFLEMVGLEELKNRYPAQLSGGQKQRVALARALVVEPGVLLLDEPLSALDLKLRQKMRFEIKRIQKKLNVTTIFVTHDQTEALAMADRIAVMNSGRLEQLGTPREIYFNPKTKFISDFIGETNFIPGSVQSIENRTANLRLENGQVIRLALSEASPEDGGALVAVRPERIFLHPEACEDKDCIQLEGEILDITFLGQLIRVHVEFGQSVLMVDEFGGMNLADQYRKMKKIWMRIDPKDCMVLPAAE